MNIPTPNPSKSLDGILEELSQYCNLILGKSSDLQLVLPNKLLEAYSTSFCPTEKLYPASFTNYIISKIHCSGGAVHLLGENELPTKPGARTIYQCYYKNMTVDDIHQVEYCLKPEEKLELEEKSRTTIYCHNFEFVKEQALAEKFFKLGYLAAHIVPGKE